MDQFLTKRTFPQLLSPSHFPSLFIMLVRDDFTSLCHNLLSYQLRFPTSEAVNLQFLPKSQSQSTTTVFQLASQSFYFLCYCTFWSTSSFFTNRNKQLFFKMRLDSPKPQKRYMHTLTVCSSRELLSQANSYWKRKKITTTRKKEQQQNKTK